MFNRGCRFWKKISSSKLASDLTEIRQIATSGWKKEIANVPKVIFYGINFSMGYHLYEAQIRPRIGDPSESDASGGGRPKFRGR